MMEEKRVPLDKLGHDILVDAVFPHLSESDILSLGLTNKEMRNYTQQPSVWHDQYFKTFGLQPNPFTIYKWPEMYRWRKTAGLYTWGQRSGGRLGYVGTDIEPEYRTETERTRFGVHPGVCKPKMVSVLGDTVISDVVAGGYSFTVLTADGKLYGVGDVQEAAMSHRRGEQVPGVVALPFTRGPVNVNVPRGIRIGGVVHHPVTENRIALPQEVDSNGNPIPSPFTGSASAAQEDTNNEQSVPPKTPLGSLKLPLAVDDRALPKQLHTVNETKFVSVSSGRSHTLALDVNNKPWTWDWSFAYPGTQLEITESDQTIHKLAAGWNFSCAYVEDEGLKVWYNVGDLQVTKYDNSDIKKVETFHVPGTANVKIMDLMCGRDFLIYLTEDGQLFRVDTSNKDDIRAGVRMSEFENKLQGNAQFVKLTGAFTKFAMFSDKDDVFMGHSENMAEPIVLPELQQVGCISIAMGDHHNLALLRGGKMLSWGCESKCCGAFGLGPKAHVEQLGAEVKPAGLVLEHPIQVPVDGHVLAIAAAGWQSAAIITKDME